MNTNMIPVGFNEVGRQSFEAWMNSIAKYPEQMNAQAWFDSMQFANFETGENTQIEVGSFFTKSGTPQLFLVTPEMVAFAEAE